MIGAQEKQDNGRSGANASKQDLDPRLELLARWMDAVFEVPGLGFRFGLDAILGLIPGFGDTATSLVSLYILNEARRCGIPRITLVRMATNIAIDYAFGAIPFLGDAFDVFWKANVRNIALLRQHMLTTPLEERRVRTGDWLFLIAVLLVLAGILAGSIAISYFVVVGLWRLSALARSG